MSNCDKKPTCYQMRLGGNMNDRPCHSSAQKNESNKYDDDKLLERRQKESEEELENARRTLRSTENVVRQSRSGGKGCPSPAKKAIKPCSIAPNPAYRPAVISGREAIKKLSKVSAGKECECPERRSKERGRRNVQDAIMHNIASGCKNETDTKEMKGLPKKPQLTTEEINELIRQEANDAESAWIITSENKEIYKKPCPKQQKARDAIKALIETKKEEPAPCFAPPTMKEPLPFLDPDPEDISPEVAANMMYTQERGIKMISCPEDTVKHLFFEQFGPVAEKESEKKKVDGITEVEEVEAVATDVAEDEVDDSVFTRNMSQQKESGEDDKASGRCYDTASKTYDKKREFLLQEKEAKCVNRIQLRGNFASWFPGYFIALPDNVGETIQLAKSPSGVFQKAWMAAKPNNLHPADLYLVE